MRSSFHPLYLHEEILLLALRDKEGTILPGAMVEYAIAGAMLAELILHGRVRTQNEKWPKLVELISAEPFNEPVLDEALNKVATAKRRAKPETWVTRWINLKKLKARVAEGLCARGILRAEEVTTLFIFKSHIYPELDPAPERAMMERLENAVFSDDANVDERTVILASLANATGILPCIFGGTRLKSRQKRLKQLTANEVAGAAARNAITTMQTLLATSVFVSVIASSS